MDRRRFLVSIGAALTTWACGLRAGAEDEGAAAVITDDPRLVDTIAATTTRPPTTIATTTTVAPTTSTLATTTTVALPVPVRVPADPYAPEPEVRLGTIRIPRLGLDTLLFQGITLTTINKGPSHWPGTALPGELGNVVVAGHRVTFTRPFRHIDRMVDGDEVVFATATGEHRYVMAGTEIVTPNGMHIIEQTPARTATLFACHPPGSARFRYVVHLRHAGDPPA